MATRPNRQPLAGNVKYWNIMIFGDPGTGKTVFAGTDNKVLFIAPESDGLMSAERMKSTAEHIEVKHWNDLKNAYEWYDEHPEDLADTNVLAIDSITEMQRLAKEYVLEVGADEKKRKGRDPEKIELQDYGLMHEMLENLVRGFNDLHVNVLWTATSKKVEDADNNEFLVPDLQGKKEYGIAMKMAALMTSYGHMRVEIHEIPLPSVEGEDQPSFKKVKRRVIYWEDSGTIRGKDRTLALAPYTVNATLQQVRLAVKGQLVRNKEGFIVKPEGKTNPASTKKTAPPVKKTVERPSPQTKKVESNQDDPSADQGSTIVADTPVGAHEVKEGSEDLALDTVQA